MLLLIISIALATTKNLSSQEINFLKKQRVESAELKKIASTIIKDNEDKKIFDHGTIEIMKASLVKIKNYENKKVVEEQEAILDLWGDCFYRIWKTQGILAAKASRDLVINTPEKERKNLLADQVFKFKILSIAKVNKQICLKKYQDNNSSHDITKEKLKKE